jgi:hypothetical protein
MNESILRKIIRRILKEESFSYAGNAAGGSIGSAGVGMRSTQSVNTMPYSFKDSIPGLNIELYPSTDGKYNARVEVEFDDSLSSDTISFETETEATHFARAYSEKIHRIMMSKGLI